MSRYLLPWWRHQRETFSALLHFLWGESTCHRWIPITKARDAELWCFLWSAPEQTVDHTIESPVRWFEMPLCPLWRKCNVGIRWTFQSNSLDHLIIHGLIIDYMVVRFTHHDDVIKWKQSPRYWPFVRGIHQWRWALVFSLICIWINGWVNNGETGGFRRYRAHYDVTVVLKWHTIFDLISGWNGTRGWFTARLVRPPNYTHHFSVYMQLWFSIKMYQSAQTDDANPNRYETTRYSKYMVLYKTLRILYIHIKSHYSDVLMSEIVSQTADVSIVYSTVCSGVDQRKYQSTVSLAFVRGIHRWPVNSPHKGPVTRKMFPFDDVIMEYALF